VRERGEKERRTGEKKEKRESIAVEKVAETLPAEQGIIFSLKLSARDRRGGEGRGKVGVGGGRAFPRMAVPFFPTAIPRGGENTILIAAQWRARARLKRGRGANRPESIPLGQAGPRWSRCR